MLGQNLFSDRVSNQAEKQAIANCALSMIYDNDTILLDVGTTTMELAKLLHVKHGLTIIVNDLQIASLQERTTDATILFLGGILRRGMHCCVGPNAINALKEINIDKAFIAANGLSAEGPSTPDVYQADIKEHMVKRAERAILLVDSSKLGKKSFRIFAHINDFHSIITDDQAEDSTLEYIRESGIPIVKATVEE